ncbi:lysozyme M1 [Lactobacillus pasteurii DSM 23907 = CRBIP 24.76]|nr:lysozyme M1 [Lactobacillus pasteurii DSM 23907 = CRBIP 24.76]
MNHIVKRFHHRLTLPLILLLLALSIGGLFWGYSNFKRDTTLPSDANPSAIGVELNQNYSGIDLHQLQENGLSFVYLRSTQGRSYFDDDYLTYRDQILGTKLAFGTVIYYSNESTARQHYDYFFKQVGNNTGSLPIMVKPAVSSRSKKYLRSMANFVSMLQAGQKNVLVALNYKYHRLFPQNTQFLKMSPKQPNKLQYSFWRYSTNGRVKNVSELDRGVTMYAYNGTVMQYKQKYGQLAQ